MILGEGLFLILFLSNERRSSCNYFHDSFALFTHMACGATYALVPLLTEMH